MSELSEAMWDLVQRVQDTAKAGHLTLTVAVGFVFYRCKNIYSALFHIFGLRIFGFGRYQFWLFTGKKCSQSETGGFAEV